ncbi:MAG TPA: amino acid adenylation domain-containing protein, partial [Bryobacteraceae bacterium]|nr:amino acid adenylation domain-containing protein [Bryobacteraceae bacterium]
MHDLIAIQAETTPDAVALTMGRKKLTYGQLNASANRLAHFLRAREIGPEVLVGLSLKRSVEMVVSILGILKAGGAYVPLDPNDPAERLLFELQDSGAKILVTTGDLATTLPVNDLTVICVDADWPEIALESDANPAPGARLANPAYAIYTSGSSGKPKGVIVTHSGLLNYLTWAAKAYGKEAWRSALVHSSISFDLTVTGLYTPLLVGGQVELVSDDASVEAVVRALRRPLTRGLVKITPAHLDLLSQQLRPEEAAGKVELFVIGGENLLAESLRFWREVSPTTRLINEYGPTETVVGCCVYEVQSGDPFTGSVPIGKAIDNTCLYVLDQQLKPVQAGLLGELYIGGAGVARGYLNRPELTSKHFLADPFSNRSGARMYKTGDMARWREDGTLEYAGRLDDQMKIRGYRVELGEIEAVAAEHPAVRQCVALAREDESGSKQVAGYVIPRDGEAVTPKELREFLRLKLPEYMVPAHFVLLDAFPLTPNGKVDRQALSLAAKTLSRHEFTPPRNAVESTLVTIWAELLGVDPVSVTDNVFDLGADSLSAAKFLARIEQSFGKQLSISTLFQAPTIQQFAVLLEGQALSTPQVIPVQPEGSLPPFFCVGAGPLFRPLALRLGTDHPFLSLMPSLLPELKQMSAPYRLEQIVGYLVNAILNYQNEGPYYLGGWSDSGVLAYETAQQLMDKGHDVPLLVLFDTQNPIFQQSALKEDWLEARARKLRFHAEELLRLKPQKVPQYVAEKMKELHRKISRAARQIQYRSRVRLARHPAEDPDQLVHLALRSYRPAPYMGRLVFFKAAERPPGNAWDFSRGW